MNALEKARDTPGSPTPSANGQDSQRVKQDKGKTNPSRLGRSVPSPHAGSGPGTPKKGRVVFSEFLLPGEGSWVINSIQRSPTLKNCADFMLDAGTEPSERLETTKPRRNS